MSGVFSSSACCWWWEGERVGECWGGGGGVGVYGGVKGGQQYGIMEH